MPTKGRLFAGCTVALVTPFRDGEVDEAGSAALGRVADCARDAGLEPGGHDGRVADADPRRTRAGDRDRRRDGRRPSQGDGRNGLELDRRGDSSDSFAARAGVDGSLQVAPYYNRPNQEGLYRHFAAIAECTDLPLVLYNVPARTGRNIEPETIERLAAIGPIVAVKEAAGSLDQVSELIARTNLTILSGDDSLTLPMLAVGAEGVVSVIANLVPRDVIGAHRGIQGRSYHGSPRSTTRRLFPLCRDLLGLAPNPIPVKTALAILGRGNGEMRLPLCPLDERSHER